MRNVKEVEEAARMYGDRLWHLRHQDLGRPEEGENAAARVEEFDLGLVDPGDDWAAGLVAGKLSALRWVLGDSWDSLDT